MGFQKHNYHDFWQRHRPSMRFDIHEPLSEKDITQFFVSPSRKINLKRVALFTLIFFTIWSVLLPISAPNARRSIAYAKAGASQLESGFNLILSDPVCAAERFSTSSGNFKKAAEEIRSINVLTKFLLVAPKIKSGIHLLQAGNSLANTGIYLTNILEKKPSKTKKTIPYNIEGILSQELSSLETFLDHQSDNILQANKSLFNASWHLAQIKASDLPERESRLIKTWQKRLPSLVKVSSGIANLVKNRQLIFGTREEPKKYLILFQNNAELRPTGGFLGSYATLTVAGQEIKEWWVQKNIYTQDKAILARQIEPPEGLKRLITWWTMRDANWDPDFPQAARDVTWFYKEEGGTQTDGVIAIDTTVVEDILRLTGPIRVPGYDFTVDAQNFVTRTAQQVELDYFKNPEGVATNEPKQYIADLADVLTAAINQLPESKRSKLLEIFVSALQRKSLMVSFFNPTLAASARELNIDGHLHNNTSGDYLYIVNSNLGGMKSSRNVLQRTKIDSKVKNDGTVIHTLIITRTHKGSGKWPDGNNRNLIDIIVPKGSKLISFSWQDNSDHEQEVKTVEEQKATIFEAWFATNIGQSKTLIVEYQTPKVVKNNRYTIYLQKQPGAQHCQIEQVIRSPQPVKSYSGDTSMRKIISTLIQANFNQTTDKALTVEF